MKKAFTLVELLVVVGIIIVIMALVIPAVIGINTAGGVTKAVNDFAGTMQMARAHAMANNTYVWVGFFEEDAGTSDVPATAGTGRVVVAVVASKDGTQVYSSTASDPGPLPSSALLPVGKLLKVSGVALAGDALTDLGAPPVPDNYRVGNADFANASTTFSYPLADPQPTYTFQKIIQFTPSGEASKIVDSPVPLMEIGLRPARGNEVDLSAANVAVIQLSGIAGNVEIYRP